LIFTGEHLLAHLLRPNLNQLKGTETMFTHYCQTQAEALTIANNIYVTNDIAKEYVRYTKNAVYVNDTKCHWVVDFS